MVTQARAVTPVARDTTWPMGPRLNSCAVALSAAALLFGCGDDGGSAADAAVFDAAPPDAMLPDAGFNAAACPGSYGPSSVAETFVIPPADVGFDLDGAADVDGDGTVDNVLGSNDTLRSLINGSLGNSLDDGGLRSLNELRDLTGLGADDSSITVVLYGGIDSDDPTDLGDDFAGDEDYYFSRLWVEPADCAPVASLTGAYAGGVVTASNDSTTFFIESLGGFVEFKRARISAAIEADTVGAKSQAGTPTLFGGAIPSCSLNKAPGTISLKAQEDVARIFSIQMDIDMDGDGLETVQAQPGDGIVSCTDGDGTVIMGEDCGCDPRIADAYSITFQLELVGAGILGPAAE